MPELGILPNTALSIPALQLDTRASYFDRTPLPVRTPDTSALSRAQGKAALFGSIADTLAKLPETLMTAYQAGKKMVTGNNTTNAYNAALAGKPAAGTSLADFKATSDGAVTFNPEDAELHRLKIEALKRQAAPSLYDTIDSGLSGGSGGGSTGLPPIPSPSDTGLPPVPPPSKPESIDVDPSNPDSLDYLDGYGKANPPAGTNPTDAQRSSLLLPPDNFKATPKPSFRGGAVPVPLSQLSEIQPSAVAPQDVAAIDGAATNIGNQLTAMQPNSSLGASTDATPAATIAPVSQEQALATFAESHPQEGISQEDTASAAATPAQTVITKDPLTKIITAKTADGRTLQIGPKENAWREVKPQGGAPTVPAMIRSEAIRMGVYKDGMTAEEVSKAMEEKQITEGIIPPHLLPQASSLARLVTQHPTLKHYPTIREAKEAVDAGLKNPDTGGFSDMALVEGFQRMVNPGASVRSQTMQQMLKAAGVGQYADLGFVLDHFKQGDKFAPEVRVRLKKLADDIYERATKNAEPQLKALGRIAKSYGISKPEDFVNNVLVMSPLFDAGGSVVPEGAAGASGPAPAIPVAPNAGMIKMRAPDGTTQYVKPESVAKYQAKGATIVP